MKKKTNVGTTSGRIRKEDEVARQERNAQWTRLAEKASRAPPPKIMKKDVDQMIRYLRRKGAPGRDEIPGWTYLLMHTPDLRKMAHRILQIVLYAGIPPETWAELWITPVFKDGDRYEVDRYRPITLMVVLAKAVEAVIQRRLQEKAGEGSM
jgi:hypothetical protein